MVDLKKVSVHYGNTKVLHDFSLSVAKGEHIAIMGPSGSGKTTVLKLITGQLTPNTGTVSVHTQRISYMFQEPRLIPWLTAAENVNLVLGDRPDTLPEAHKWLERVGLEDASDKYPSALSGGMKQRTALARALAYGGDLLLLDEPLSSQDEGFANEMLTLIERYSKDKTVIFVTHNTNQAKRFAEKIYVIKNQNA